MAFEKTDKNYDSIQRKTVDDFGRQWSAYQDNDGYYGSVELLADYFGPLLEVAGVSGLRVCDIGSGTGRVVNMLLAAGAAHVTAVEPSSAFSVLEKNTAAHADRVTLLNITGDQTPPSADMDLAVAFGVLHHIPDPGPTVRAAFQALRPGGRFVVWLYGREGNELYLSIVGPLRRVAKRLPHGALAALSKALSVPVSLYGLLCRRVPLPMRGYFTGVAGRLTRQQVALAIYDQLNPAWAKYYSKQEAIELLEREGFTTVRAHHRHNYSWTVAGTRPET